MKPNPLLVPRIFWLLFVVSTFAYLAFLLFVLKGPRIDPMTGALRPPDLFMIKALGTISVVEAVLALVVPRHLLRKAAQKLAERVALQTPKPEAAQLRESALSQAALMGIIQAALAESIATYGTTLAMAFNATVTQYLPFFGLAWLLLVMVFPRERAVLAPFEEALGMRLAT